MVVNRKVTGTASSMPAGFLMSTAVSLVLTVAGAGLFAYLISKEILQESSIGYCAMVLVLLSAIAGAAAAVGRIKRRRVYVCAISGVIYFGILLSMTALFFGGQYQGIGVTALLVLAGCGLVALLGLKGEKKAYRGKRKFGNR